MIGGVEVGTEEGRVEEVVVVVLVVVVGVGKLLLLLLLIWRGWLFDMV